MAKAKKKKARTTLIVLTSDQDFQKALETMGRATKKTKARLKRKEKKRPTEQHLPTPADASARASSLSS